MEPPENHGNPHRVVIYNTRKIDALTRFMSSSNKILLDSIPFYLFIYPLEIVCSRKGGDNVYLMDACNCI
jgi:hypothetical protein